MPREREGQNNNFDMGDPFGNLLGFGRFGCHRSMMPSLFGGQDPFDDPFFTRPYGSMFESSIFAPSTASSETPRLDTGKGIVIEELNSDEEGENKEDKINREEKDNYQKHSGFSKEPSVEHPDDDDSGIKSKNYHNGVEASQPQARSFRVQSCKVTFGGIDGAYYTSTRTRRTGSDGVILEETKEADKTTGQATHRLSRGIHDKGHSVVKKLNSDGNVDTTQTLHNLDEDELAGFEEAWKGNVGGHLPSWTHGFGVHGNAGNVRERKQKASPVGWALPSIEGAENARRTGSENERGTNSNAARGKKVVRINIE